VTARIYYTDPYCRRFEAVVTKAFEHEGRPAAVLDRTAFYPSSGGQPFDTGSLLTHERDGLFASTGQPGAVDVVETVDDENEVVHVLSAPIGQGIAVRGEIDWNRRFDHMQQHTGQHLLSAAFDRLFENPTTSFHLGADAVTIDLLRETSWEQISLAEREANRVVWENRAVSIRFVDPGRPESSDAPLPFRKKPTREGVLRLIEVTDFDLSACGGTHVARTGAIGIIGVAGAEKFKGGTRIAFACGGRALRLVATLRESVAGSVKALSVLPQELPAAIARMQAETKDLRRTIKTLQGALAGHEAARLIADRVRRADPSLSDEASRAEADGPVGVHIVVEALEGWDANGLKAIASAVTAGTRAAVALFSTTSPYAVVIARSADVPVDANAILRALTDRFGGRGGGKPDLAQGGGLCADLAEITRAARSLLISNSS
jgi:alanyl-tRNA synthetase